MEDLCRKTDDVIKFFVRRTDQRQTEIPLDTKVTDVLCRCEVRFSKVNSEAQLHTQTNEKCVRRDVIMASADANSQSSMY